VARWTPQTPPDPAAIEADAERREIAKRQEIFERFKGPSAEEQETLWAEVGASVKPPYPRVKGLHRG
jgi:hypothetical protein